MHPPLGPVCVCHVLLLETDNGLVLVDAGFGVDDCADPKGRVGPVRFFTRPECSFHRGRGTPARPARLPPRGRPPHRPHPPGHRPRWRRSGFSACATPRHRRGGVRSVQCPDPRREGSVRPTALGKRARHRRTQPDGRIMARIFRGEGTRRDRVRHCARLAARPHPRSRLHCGRRGPVVGCCIAVTPSTTTAPWTTPTCRALCGPWRRRSHSIERRCGTTTLACQSSTATPRTTCSSSRLMTRHCSSAPRRPLIPFVRAPAPLCRRSPVRPESGVPQRRWQTARPRGQRGRRYRRPVPR